MNDRIFAIIVLYQERWADIPAQPFLERAVSEGLCSLMIHDNSAAAQTEPFFENKRVTYIHDGANPGLATAYNRALQVAEGYDWLLLLDQDTVVPIEYFEKLIRVASDSHAVALVPQIVSAGRQISPVAANKYIDRRAVSLEPGVYQERVMAINSGSCINRGFLTSIQGFNEEFPLDFLDHWLFWKIFQLGQTVEVMAIKLEHELSVLDYSTLDLARYQGILKSEMFFYRKYDRKNLTAHRGQLFLRTLKQFLRVKDRRFWKVTLKEFLSKGAVR